MSATFMNDPYYDLDNAPDHLLVCRRCHQPYRLVGKGDERRILPDHKLWCSWHRPPAAPSAPGVPRSATQAPEVPEAHPSATSQPTSAQAATGGGAP